MMEIDPDRRSRPIMLPTVAGTPVVWSSDGTKLLVSDGPRLKVVDLGGRETVAVRNAFPGGASFTPDGRHVVYADEHLGLREVSIHGGPARAITPRSSQPPGTGRIDPVVSPDGTRIAYRRVLGRRFIQGIWVMNRDGTQRHVLVSPARLGRLSGELAVDQIANICWSPDGSRLAFTAGTGNGYRGGVFTVNSDGGGLRRLTPLAAGMWGATWSPDGKRIASMDSSKEVITMSADGTHTRDLGYRALTWSSLAWNPAQRVMTPPHH